MGDETDLVLGSSISDERDLELYDEGDLELDEEEAPSPRTLEMSPEGQARFHPCLEKHTQAGVCIVDEVEKV